MRKLVKKLIPKSLFASIEPYGHLGEAVVANLIYRFPAKGLKVIGVTGTDGKTTTSTLITTMLRSAGYKVGMMTTISLDYGDGPQPNPTRLTTVSAIELFKIIRKMKKAGIEWLVLETTSHALAQYRVWGVPYSIAVMTNITHEHLDYHKTFEKYRSAKLKLFKKAKRKSGFGIYNADDQSARLFLQETKKGIGYGIKAGELRAKNIKTDTTGSEFDVKFHDQAFHIKLNLPGSFNVYNALATVGVGLVLRLEPKQIEDGIESLKSVEGRMNTIDLGQDFTAIVDYAHTPESFEKIFNEVRPITNGRMIVVFGSAGERDQAKRAIQGKTAGQMCDVVIVTEEDDRTEDGMIILDEIAAGAKSAGKTEGKDLFLIHDRAEAIRAAVKIAKAGDTVLMLGKGHEKSILGRDGKKPWDEIAETKKVIKENE